MNNNFGYRVEDVLTAEEENTLLQDKLNNDLTLLSSLWGVGIANPQINLNYRDDRIEVYKIDSRGSLVLYTHAIDANYWTYHLINFGENTKMYATKEDALKLQIERPFGMDPESRRGCLHYFHATVKEYMYGLLSNFNDAVVEEGIFPTGWELLNFQYRRYEEIKLENTTISSRVHPQDLNPKYVTRDTEWELTYTVSAGKEIKTFSVPHTGEIANWKQAKLNGCEIIHENFIETLEFLTTYAQFIRQYSQGKKTQN